MANLPMHRSLDKPLEAGETRSTQSASAPDRTLHAEGMPSAVAGGRYVVTGFLGEGARKRVYLAHDSVLDRDVAGAGIGVGGPAGGGRGRHPPAAPGARPGRR